MNLKPSQVVAKGIKLRNEGKIEKKIGTLYAKNEKNGKCQMCVDGLFIRFYAGLRAVQNFEGCGVPPDDLMRKVGLEENVSVEQAQKLSKKVFSAPDYADNSVFREHGIPIFQVCFVANDKRVSWERIQAWLESLGK